MIEKSLDKLNTVDAKLGHFRKGQKRFLFANSFSYSTDVKPIINKNRFEFI